MSKKNPIVITIDQGEKAFLACQHLVASYNRGSVSWEDLDDAYHEAVVAVGDGWEFNEQGEIV